eukprot:1402301-Amphidinium_carterae.1
MATICNASHSDHCVSRLCSTRIVDLSNLANFLAYIWNLVQAMRKRFSTWLAAHTRKGDALGRETENDNQYHSNHKKNKKFQEH